MSAHARLVVLKPCDFHALESYVHAGIGPRRWNSHGQSPKPKPANKQEASLTANADHAWSQFDTHVTRVTHSLRLGTVSVDMAGVAKDRSCPQTNPEGK